MAEMPEISGVPKLSSGAMTAPGETSLKKKPIVTPAKKPAVAKSLSSRRDKFYQQEGFDRDAHAERVTSAMGSMLGDDSGGMQGLIEGLASAKKYRTDMEDRAAAAKKEKDLDNLYAQLGELLAEGK